MTVEQKSHPVWVRGLKPVNAKQNGVVAASHPVWVRGLKQGKFMKTDCTFTGRTPCGCVD